MNPEYALGAAPRRMPVQRRQARPAPAPASRTPVIVRSPREVAMSAFKTGVPAAGFASIQKSGGGLPLFAAATDALVLEIDVSRGVKAVRLVSGAGCEDIFIEEISLRDGDRVTGAGYASLAALNPLCNTPFIIDKIDPRYKVTIKLRLPGNTVAARAVPIAALALI
jgi:hypothetical protein